MPDLSVQVEIWRDKIARNELTTEDMKEIVRTLRAGRIAAGETKAKSKSTSTKASVDVDQLLDDLDKL